MDCLFKLLAICIFDPSNLYITGEFVTPFNQALQIKAEPLHIEGYWCGDHWCRGPLASLRLGMVIQLKQGLEVDLGLRHQSFIHDDDRGQEGAFVSFTYRPFR